MRTSKLWFLLCLLPVLAAPPALSQAASSDASTDANAAGETKDEAPAGEVKASAGDTQAAEQATSNPLVGPGGGGDGEQPFPLKAFLSTTTSIGQGTFIVSGLGNPMVLSTVNVTPYLAWDKWWFMYSQSVSAEWTPPNDGSFQGRPYLSDGSLGARYWGFALPELGLRFPVTLSARLPISMASRHAGILTGLSGTAAMQWITPFSMMFSASVNGSYNVVTPGLFPRQIGDSEYQDKYSGETMTAHSCLQRSPLESTNFACGTIPRAGTVGASLSAIWFAHEQVMVNGSLGFSTSFPGYFSPDDEFKSPNARAGLVPSYSTRSSFSVSYAPWSWLWLGAGVDTGQPLFAADGTTPRWFPLWDIISPYNNLTVFTLDATFVL